MFNRTKFKDAIKNNDYNSASKYAHRIKRKGGLSVNFNSFKSDFIGLLENYRIPFTVSFNINDTLDTIINEVLASDSIVFRNHKFNEINVLLNSTTCLYAAYKEIGHYLDIKPLFVEKVFKAGINEWFDHCKELVPVYVYNQCCVKYKQYNSMVFDQKFQSVRYLQLVENDEFETLVNFLLDHNRDLSDALEHYISRDLIKSKLLVDKGVKINLDSVIQRHNHIIEILNDRKQTALASTISCSLEYYCITNNILYPGKKSPMTVKWQNTCITCKQHLWYSKILLTPCAHIMCQTCALKRLYCTECNTKITGSYIIPNKLS